MKHLLTISDHDIDPNLPVSGDIETYHKRSASRAITLSDKGEVHLINVSLHGYHKLPGGGINQGEDERQALKRELLEEIGCDADITTEVGTITEYRHFEELNQTSFCYIAMQKGEQVENAFEEDEIAEGMQQTLAASIDDAIALLEQDEPNNIEGRFIKIRDTMFLKAAKEILAKSSN